MQLQYVNALAFAALGLVAVRQWYTLRTEPARWMAVAFGLIGAVAAIGAVQPEGAVGVVPLILQRLLILGIIGYVWCLLRFLASLDPDRDDRLMSAGDALSLAVAVAALALPDIPGQGDSRPWWFQLWILLFLLQWVGIHGVVSRRLWTAGATLTTVPRRRARLLSVGAALFAIVLLPAASADPVDHPVAAAVIAFLPIVSALAFIIGFAPPAWLRSQWRRPELAALREATIGLMTVTAPADVAMALLPPVVRMVGGSSASLIDRDGSVIGTYRTSSADSTVSTISIEAGSRRLEIESGPYAPFFGAEESSLVQSLGVMIDIALDRAAAMTGEREARARAEEVSAELETLVYGLSHDLKTPIISLLGYLEYLDEDHSAVMNDEGRFFIERMRSSALYMQDLINDLLELSRVGRAQTEVGAVPLDDVVSAVVERLAGTYPTARVTVGPDLPVILANPVRMQQLFTNLVENACKHGGRPDIGVFVVSRRTADGIDIDVADDGKGIPAEYRETVFDIFERLDSVDGPRGTGVGLAMCRRIAETIGGTLTVVEQDAGADSQAGTAFRLSVPARSVADRPADTAIGGVHGVG
ncbi:MAG: sensor histidine kinase [Acidimicrobiales bacterium]